MADGCEWSLVLSSARIRQASSRPTAIVPTKHTSHHAQLYPSHETSAPLTDRRINLSVIKISRGPDEMAPGIGRAQHVPPRPRLRRDARAIYLATSTVASTSALFSKSATSQHADSRDRPPDTGLVAGNLASSACRLQPFSPHVLARTSGIDLRRTFDSESSMHTRSQGISPVASHFHRSGVGRGRRKQARHGRLPWRHLAVPTAPLSRRSTPSHLRIDRGEGTEEGHPHNRDHPLYTQQRQKHPPHRLPLLPPDHLSPRPRYLFFLFSS